MHNSVFVFLLVITSLYSLGGVLSAPNSKDPAPKDPASKDPASKDPAPKDHKKKSPADNLPTLDFTQLREDDYETKILCYSPTLPGHHHSMSVQGCSDLAGARKFSNFTSTPGDTEEWAWADCAITFSNSVKATYQTLFNTDNVLPLMDIISSKCALIHGAQYGGSWTITRVGKKHINPVQVSLQPAKDQICMRAETGECDIHR